MARQPARLLIIAGSDSGGGAGIQADLRTCAAHDVFGTTAITAVTAQNTVSVRAVVALEPDLVRAQIDAVLDDIGTDAVKIGMLANAPIVRAVVSALRAHGAGVRSARVPGRVHGVDNLVLDPVMVAKSGDSLLAPEAVSAVRELLVPLARVVTPNVPELAALVAATEATTEAERQRQAARLAAAGPAVVAKGGHAVDDQLVDLLVAAPGLVGRWSHPRRDTKATHGTGCTLSTAIACRLAHGHAVEDAVGGAIAYLQAAIAAAQPIGQGHGPVNHLWEWNR